MVVEKKRSNNGTFLFDNHYNPDGVVETALGREKIDFRNDRVRLRCLRYHRIHIRSHMRYRTRPFQPSPE